MVSEPIPRELQSSWVFLCSKAENDFQVGKWVRDVNLVGQIAGDWIAALKAWVLTSPRGSKCSRILLFFNGGCWTNYTSLPVPVLWYKRLYDQRPKVKFYFYMIWIILVILMVQVTDLVFCCFFFKFFFFLKIVRLIYLCTCITYLVLLRGHKTAVEAHGEADSIPSSRQGAQWPHRFLSLLISNAEEGWTAFASKGRA